MSKRKGVLDTNIGIQLLFLGSKTLLFKKKKEKKGGAIKYFSQMSLFFTDVIAQPLTLDSPLK